MLKKIKLLFFFMTVCNFTGCQVIYSCKCTKQRHNTLHELQLMKDSIITSKNYEQYLFLLENFGSMHIINDSVKPLPDYSSTR